MSTLETICARKSVRSYTGEPLTDDQRTALLKAANAAPIGMGKYEDMHLTVIDDAALLQELDAACAAAFGNPDAHPFYGAPTVVVVSTKVPEGPAANVAYSNAATIIENMALEAAELGVGACHLWGGIMTIAASPELTAKLQLPEGFTPCCGIALGQTDETYAQREIPMDRIAQTDLA